MEFNLAYLKEGTPPIPTETRQVTLAGPVGQSPARRAINNVAKLLHSNDLPVDLNHPDDVNIHNWQVDLDGSIENPMQSDVDSYKFYGYVPMEIKTPALEFNPDSLKQVKQVCDLLQSTYVVSNNPSTGLHVHTGRFSAPVPFHIIFLKKLIIFLYVFDPQIASLHPAHRVENSMMGSIRDQAAASADFQVKNGRRPLPADLVPLFLDAPDLESLLNLATRRLDRKYADYNFTGLQRAATATQRGKETDGDGHTIEFRQHAGTLDGEAICMWVRVLAGIIDFVEDASPESYVELIGALLRAETWEKEYDGRDDEREEMYGPIPAESSFTIIDLLNHINLKEEATYYESRWMIHTRDEPRPRGF